MSFLRLIHNMWVSVVIGILSGLLVVPLAIFLTNKAQEYLDAAHPIATGVAELIDREKESLTARITIQKLEEGSYLKIAAYDATVLDAKIPLYMERLDRVAEGTTHPVNTVTTGIWRVWPTEKTKKVEFYVNYKVDNRVVPVFVGKITL
jgi:hypothetical protein